MAHIPAPSRYRQAGGRSSSSTPTQRETNHLLQDTTPSSSSSSFTSTWTPTFGLAFRLLLVLRLLASRFSIISDCDEVFNYWEALHLLVFPGGEGTGLMPFQTWEYAPQFAIRSYAYLLPYLGFAKVARSIVPVNKIDTFFILRNMLAVISSLIEAKFIVSVGESIHPRVSKYLFFLLLTSAGMSSAATALLPSTFTMYTTTLACAYAFYPSRLPSPNPIPAPSNLQLAHTPFLRTFLATATFALGALLGWPFAIVLSLPFVLEEVFLPSGNSVPVHKRVRFLTARLWRFVHGALLSGLFIGGVTTIIDSLAYGRVVVVPLRIVLYNVLSAKRGAGPELYGTEPASFYFANLGLAFNIALPLALLSAPLAILTALVEPKQLGPPSRSFPLSNNNKGKKDALVSSSRLGLLLIRLAPFYLWLGLLTLQSHKEERFMFPAYPLVCFNAAVAVYLVRALLEKLLAGSSTSRNTQTPSRLPSTLTTLLLLTTSVLSLLRTTHLQSSFYAPTAILEHIHSREIPQLLSRAFPASISAAVPKARLAAGLEAFGGDEQVERAASARAGLGGAGVQGMLFDWFRVTSEPVALPSLAGLVNMSILLTEFGGVGQPEPLRVCYGKEWYRFPGHFFVPPGVGVDFVKSEFEGILPKHFAFSNKEEETLLDGPGWESRVVNGLEKTLGWSWGWKNVTRTVQDGFNDMNREEPDRYVDINTCDYLVDLDHPHRFASSTDPRRSSLEPRHAIDSERWSRVHCIPFLDSTPSDTPKAAAGVVHKVLAVLDRTVYIPGPVRAVVGVLLRPVLGGAGAWESGRRYGDYCLLRTKREESWANRRG
ncbi:unnamed protein product [Tilletia controversa]|nr:unnamed protein product [Tilletia controversa]